MGGAHVLMIVMKVMKVKGLVMVIMLVLLEVKVLVEVFVVREFAEEALLLFSLSSTPTPTTMPQTRPAARVWAWGAKGLDARPRGNVDDLAPLAPAVGRRLRRFPAGRRRVHGRVHARVLPLGVGEPPPRVRVHIYVYYVFYTYV